MSRTTENVILFLLGTCIAAIVVTGTFTRYVKPAVMPWLAATAVLLVVLALSAAIRDVRARGGRGDDVDQPDGDLGLRGFLGDLGRPEPLAAEALLRQHFPAFREMDQGLEKWWALELANLGQQQGFEFLSPQETERLLSEALSLRFEAVATPVADEGDGMPEKRGFLDWFKAKPKRQAPPPQEAFVGSVDQFESYLKRSGAKERLTTAFDRIQTLKRGGFPLYRPVFTAYERAIARLLKDDTKDLVAEFAAIAETRRKISETLERSRDYLNHFEATRAPRLSGEFDEYFRIREAYDQRVSPRKNDPITRYMDALEAEFR